MAQFARPDEDITVGGWTATPLWSKIDEVTPDDADLITSPAGQTQCEIGLTTVTDPNVSTGHIMRVRAQRPGGPVLLNVRLYQGATQIAIISEAMPASFTTFTYTLTAGEANSITNYGDLRVRMDDNHDSRQADVSWFEFEVPDAAGPVTVNLNPATLTMTGPRLTVKVARKVIFQAALLNGTGPKAQINRTVRLAASTLTITGLPLRVQQTVRLDPGILTFTGPPLTVLGDRTVALQAAILTLTGPPLQVNQTVRLQAGLLTLTGLALQVNQTVRLNAAILTFTGPPLRVLAAQVIALNPAALTLTGGALVVPKTVELNPATLTLFGPPLTVVTVGGVTVVLNPAVLLASGLPLQVNQTVRLDAGVLTLNGLALQVNQTVGLEAGVLTLNGPPVTLQLPVTVVLQAAVLVMAGLPVQLAGQAVPDVAPRPPLPYPEIHEERLERQRRANVLVEQIIQFNERQAERERNLQEQYERELQIQARQVEALQKLDANTAEIERGLQEKERILRDQVSRVEDPRLRDQLERQVQQDIEQEKLQFHRDVRRKAQNLINLERARQAKLEKQKRAEAIKAQRIKNLKKARRVLRRKRNK